MEICAIFVAIDKKRASACLTTTHLQQIHYEWDKDVLQTEFHFSNRDLYQQESCGFS